MDYFLLFLADGVLGYVLQAVGFVIGLYAFTRRKINWAQGGILSIVFALIMFCIRQVHAISFGFHTILIMIAVILIAVLFLKMPVFRTVMGTICTCAAIAFGEILNFVALQTFMGVECTNQLLSGDGTVVGEIAKALAGAPTNLFVILVMTILYCVIRRTACKKEPFQDGTMGEESGK